MVTENNSYVNSFSGGMNSDTSIDEIKQNQYLESRNVRITSYSSNGEQKLNKQQQILPIEGLVSALNIPMSNKPEILASTTTRNYGIIVYKNGEKWGIFRFKNAISRFNGKFNYQDITDYHDFGNFSVKEAGWDNVHSVSVVTRYESDDIIKLYIADGVNPILVFNIAPSNESYVDSNTDISKYKSYPKVIFKKPEFKGYIQGNLKASLVAYSYQLYNKNGISTDISPACKFIPIANNMFQSNPKEIHGDDQGSYTNCGCQISIENDKYSEFLDRIIVYRTMYEQNGQTPTISIIYDGSFQQNIIINDTGQQSVSDITIEQYNSMSGIHIIPKVIENKDDYLFAANVKEIQSSTQNNEFKDWDSRAFQFTYDNGNIYAEVYDGNWQNHIRISPDNLDSGLILPSNPKADQVNIDTCQKNYDVNKQYDDKQAFDRTGQYYGGSGTNIEWRFIITQKIGDASVKTDKDLPIGNIWNLMNKNNPNQESSLKIDQIQNGVKTYFIKRDQSASKNSYEEATGLYSSNEEGRWRNPELIRSLRRDELYRYGIVLYDEYGQPSPVKWIADIRTPNVNVNGFEIACQNGVIDGAKYECTLNVLGVAFKVKNLPSGCTGYEIVRCGRNFDNIATVSQGIIAKSVKPRYIQNEFNAGVNTYSSPIIFTSSTMMHGYDWEEMLNNPSSTKEDCCECDSLDNNSIYQFASPEVVYQKESFKTLIKDYKYNIIPQCFVYGRRGDQKYTNTAWSNYVLRFNKQLYQVDNWICPSTNNCTFRFYDGHGSENNRFDGRSICVDNPYLRDSLYRASYSSTKEITLPLGSKELIMSTPYANSSVYDWEQWYGKEKLHYGGYDQLQNDYNMYTCIKLYTQSNSVAYTGDTQKKSDKKSPVETISVKDIQIPDNFQWNDFSDGGYKNRTIAVGDQSYCNVMAGGRFGYAGNENWWYMENNYLFVLPWKDGYTSTDVKADQSEVVIQGPAGSCAILQIDSNNSLRNSYGAANYAVNSYYNNFQNYQNSLCSKNSIDPNSVAGTHICNLRKQTTPYGGPGDQYRKNSSYYSDGDFFNEEDKWESVFNGDCDVQIFEYVGLHKSFSAWDSNHLCYSTEIFYDVPIETQIRLYLEDGVMPYKNLETNESGNRTSYAQIEPSQVSNRYSQGKPMYRYNTAYSADNTLRTHSAYSYTDQSDYNKHIDYRCRYSNHKENSESIDQWTKFQSSNFLDVDSNYGPITNLRSFKSYLVFWQEFATGNLSVNERAMTTNDDNGSSLILGTGGVLSRYDYFDTTSGMHEGQFCDTQSNNALYWYDYNNQEARALSGGQLNRLSKSLFVDGIINKYASKDIQPRLSYDLKNNEILFSVLNVDGQKSSLVYNEHINIFTSIYTIDNDDAIPFVNGMYVIKSTDDSINIAQWNCADSNTPYSWDKPLYTYVKYAVNKNSSTVKVFDNQEIVTTSDLDNREDKNTYFSKNHEYTWKTDLINTEDTLKDQITLREGNYRYAIPRAIDDQKYGLRMRGKYMECTIKNNKPLLDVGIQYIITKFRQSWS